MTRLPTHSDQSTPRALWHGIALGLLRPILVSRSHGIAEFSSSHFVRSVVSSPTVTNSKNCSLSERPFTSTHFDNYWWPSPTCLLVTGNILSDRGTDRYSTARPGDSNSSVRQYRRSSHDEGEIAPERNSSRYASQFEGRKAQMNVVPASSSATDDRRSDRHSER